MSAYVDIRLGLSVVASVLAVVSYVPYIRDTLARKTEPHLYTWLIWAITQGTAAAAAIYGGSIFAGAGLLVGALCVLSIVALSLKYGTKNITTGDTITLVCALLAVVVWWQMHSPLLAVLMVTAIDGFGYIPTFRKSYAEPWSETLSFWFMMGLISLLILLSNTEYNWLTIPYTTMMATANFSLFFLLIARRRVVKDGNKG